MGFAPELTRTLKKSSLLTLMGTDSSPSSVPSSSG
nr:MAG TPA: hypothetical protein [Caudoviricetes sp.]